MIIDFHTHSFPDKIADKALAALQANSHTELFRRGTNDSLTESMEQDGIDYSVVLPVATAPKQVVHINDTAAQVNEIYRDKGLISFAGMHPDFEGWKEELSRVKEMGIRGVKFHPVYQKVDLDDIRFLRIIDRCAELGLIMITHAGLDVGLPGEVYCSPQMSLHALREVCGTSYRRPGNGEPGMTDNGFAFVLAHMGGWRNWDEVTELAPEFLEAGPVYLDTAFSLGQFSPLPDGYWTEEDSRMLSEEEFVKMVRAYGADRILFATDSPWSSQRETVDMILKSGLDDREKELILGENAAVLLGLSPKG